MRAVSIRGSCQVHSSSSAAALLLLLALFTLAASAGTAEVQRCRDASGTVVYTDRPCGSLRATPLPMPAAMRLRVEDTSPREELDVSGASSDVIRPRPSTARRTLGCARSAGQLSHQVQQAVGLQDVNRLAESYHWVGQSNGQAEQLMLQLERIVSKPLLDARLFDAQIFSAGTSNPEQLAGGGMMQIHLGGAGSSRQLIDLDVVRYSGCYFARFQNGRSRA